MSIKNTHQEIVDRPGQGPLTSGPDSDYLEVMARAVGVIKNNPVDDLELMASSVGVLRQEDGNKPEQSTEVDFTEHALELTDTEIARWYRNGGSRPDHVYRENQQQVRNVIVAGVIDGSLYGDREEQFVGFLSYLHTIAASRSVYNRVGSNKRGLLTGEHGKLRRGGSINRRKEESKRVSEIAEWYGDSYSTRFSEGEFDWMGPRLPNVSDQGQPRDKVSENGVYTFFYPDSEFLPQYFSAARELGIKISDALMTKNMDVQKIVELVGMQYQYLACARPFAQINNSLFMNLTNAQLKLAGLNGISHGELDLVAQRLQPETFARYFSDFVFDQQKRPMMSVLTGSQQ